MVPARLPPQTPPVPTRVVWLLTAVVVLAHVLTLRGMAMNLQAPDTLSTRVFTTRGIQIQPPAATVATLPRRPISITPRPRPEPRPKPPLPPSTDGALSSAIRAAEPASTPEPVPPAPVFAATPEPSAQAVVVGEPAQPASAPVPAPITPAAAAVALALLQEPPVEQSAPVAPAPAPEPEPVAVAVAGAATRPLTIPGSIRLSFNAVGKRGRLEYKAMGDMTWLQDGATYEMRMEMGDWIIGKRVLSSTGKLTGGGLAPTRFSDKFRSERAAHFDRQHGRIVFSANTPQADLMPGAQDQLSIFAQLAALVAGDPLDFPIGTTLTIQTVGPREAEPWVFSVEREEMLYLPGGHVPALKLVRLPNKDHGQKVELWLAPELGFLPARILITFANGDYLDQQWRSSRPP